LSCAADEQLPIERVFFPSLCRGRLWQPSETTEQQAKPKSNIQRFCDELQADADYTAEALKTATDKKDICRLKRRNGYIL
jgi:hypothetical protein